MPNKKKGPTKYYRDLTDEEEEGLKDLREALKETKYKSVLKDTAKLLRFLRARKFDVEGAKNQIEANCRWREEYQPHKLTPEKDFPDEKDKGVAFVVGESKSKVGGPILMIWPGLNFPGERDLKQAENLMIYLFEEMEKRLPKDGSVEKFTILYDRVGFQRKNFDKDFLKNSQSILSEHYPERIESILILRSDFLFWVLWKIVKPFFDPVTAAKIHTLSEKEVAEGSLEFIDKDQLWTVLGGEYNWNPPNKNFEKLFDIEFEYNNEDDLNENEKKEAIQEQDQHNATKKKKRKNNDTENEDSTSNSNSTPQNTPKSEKKREGKKKKNQTVENDEEGWETVPKKKK